MEFQLLPGGTITAKSEFPATNPFPTAPSCWVRWPRVPPGSAVSSKGEDALATVAAFRAMGVEIEGPENGRYDSRCGPAGLQAPAAPLDLGNSGTSIRLLCGLLAGQPFDTC